MNEKVRFGWGHIAMALCVVVILVGMQRHSQNTPAGQSTPTASATQFVQIGETPTTYAATATSQAIEYVDVLNNVAAQAIDPNAIEFISLSQEEILSVTGTDGRESQVYTGAVNVASVTAFGPPCPAGQTFFHTKKGNLFNRTWDGQPMRHRGFDGACTGGIIGASASGIVVKYYENLTGQPGEPPLLSGMGNVLMLEHNLNGQVCYSIYGHLEAAYVTVGTLIDAGQSLGKMGSTGKSTGPHLHYAKFCQDASGKLVAVDPEFDNVLGTR